MKKQRPQLVYRIPPRDWLTNDLVLDGLFDFLEEKNLELYPAQEEAIVALFENKNVILNTPTGSGKSLVATALHLKSWAWGRRSVYTCPIKALVNEKFLALCRDFGSAHVGIITGDSSVNADAPILCCTAEILSNMALRYGSACAVDDVVMDEFHYYSDKERGVAWQIPLLTMRDTRFLLMSATLGDTQIFEEKLTALNGLETLVIKSSQRPVPLDFSFREVPLHETVQDLLRERRVPIYLVHFTQLDAAEAAQNLLSIDFCSKEEKQALAEALVGFKFDSPFGKDIQKLLRHGVGLHHAGLLPKYRILVEKLAQQGLLKIICGTDTLGVGVNVPIRTVVFTKLCKFDGEKTGILSVRDFKQIAGRAGRKGFDDAGSVVVQAPEHIVENLRMEQKAAGDKSKMRKMVKKKPPERGFVHWDKATFDKLIESNPEQLVSRFQVSHGMLLHVLAREENGVEAMREIVRQSHETAVTKKRLRKRCFELFRSLRERKIVEIVPQSERTSETRSPVRLNVTLQLDFSLNQTLAIFMLDAIGKLDKEDPLYPFRLLSVVESIHEDPEIILRKQQGRLKTIKMNEMKMEGLEYEERMAELEKIEYPKPEKEFIYSEFNSFVAAHPWIGTEGIKPKCVAREIYEDYYSFNEYIKEYEIQRSEGMLLRYLSYVYKSLAQSVPDQMKTDELWAIESYFGTMLRDVDSSLLDEWTTIGLSNLREIDPQQIQAVAISNEPNADLFIDITRSKREFTILLRNAVYAIVRALALKEFDAAETLLNGGPRNAGSSNADSSGPISISAKHLEALILQFEEEHKRLEFGPDARQTKHTSITELGLDNPDSENPNYYWKVEQMLIDAEQLNDWMLTLLVNIDASREAGKPILTFVSLGPV